MTPVLRRAKLPALAGAGLIAASLALAFAAPGAGAQPAKGRSSTAPPVRSGDNGTVKIHSSATSVTDPRDEPHVCVFYLDAFGFDAGQSVSWRIESWPPAGGRAVVSSGVLTLDGNGDGRTADMTLRNGHYKLLWNFAGEHGFAKQKVFWVTCAAPAASASPTPAPASTATVSPGPTVSPTAPAPASSTAPPVTTAASPSPSSSVPPAPAPTPVSATLPVTG